MRATWWNRRRFRPIVPGSGIERKGEGAMGRISSIIKGNFLAVSLGLAVLTAILIAVGWGQGAAFASMLLGGIMMFHVGAGDPVDLPEQG